MAVLRGIAWPAGLSADAKQTRKIASLTECTDNAPVQRERHRPRLSNVLGVKKGVRQNVRVVREKHIRVPNLT